MKLKSLAEYKLLVIEQAIKRIEESNYENIDGSLRVIHGKRVEFHHCFKENGRARTKYIDNSKKDLAVNLAMKQFYKDSLPPLKRERKVLCDFLEKYRPEDKYEVFDSMQEERKALCKPLFVSVKEKVKAWQDEKPKLNPNYPDELKYLTKRGEKVRSKSEVIIAGMLDDYNELDYRYEKPLMIEGVAKPFYPDFTIINKTSGEVFYLEHFGLMENAEYATSFVKKINFYTKNNIFYGRNLFFSFETQKDGLDMVALRKTIERML